MIVFLNTASQSKWFMPTKKGYRNTQNYDIENFGGFYKRIIGATVTTI